MNITDTFFSPDKAHRIAIEISGTNLAIKIEGGSYGTGEQLVACLRPEDAARLGKHLLHASDVAPRYDIAKDENTQ